MRKLLTLIICVISAYSSSGLTLKEARQKAIQNYPLIHEYSLTTQSEQYTIAIASKAWLPQATIGAQSSFQSSVASYPEALTNMLQQQGVNVEGVSKLQYKLMAEVRQTIWDGGRLKAQQDVARSESREKQLSTDVELYQLRERVDQLFFSVLLLEQQKEALVTSLQLLRANQERMMSLWRNGAASQSDVDAIDVEILSTNQQLTSVESSIASFRNMLAIFTGGNDQEPLEFPAEILVSDDNSASTRPEMLLLDTSLETLDALKGEVNATVRPSLRAFVQGYYGYPGFNFMEAMMRRRPNLNAMIGLTFSWDLGAFYTKSTKLKQLTLQRRYIEVAREVFQFNVKLQATQQRYELIRYRQIMEDDTRVIELRTRVRKASEARLREGVIESTQLLTRICDEKNAILAANSHRIEYLMHLYQLQNILNTNINE